MSEQIKRESTILYHYVIIHDFLAQFSDDNIIQPLYVYKGWIMLKQIVIVYLYPRCVAL